MLITSNAVNGEIRPGDLVISVPADEYSCLIGTVTEIRPLDSPDRDTENETDDVYVNFADSEYSNERRAEIEADFSDLYEKHRPFDELPLDSVIMNPANLIRITGIYSSELSELLDSGQAAEAYCEQMIKITKR